MSEALWDPVTAIRDCREIPSSFNSDRIKLEEALARYRSRIPSLELRQIYSLQSSIEIIKYRDRQLLVWDWRWIEHMRRIVRSCLLDVGGYDYTLSLPNLLLCERALEDFDEDLARGALFALKRTGNNSFRDIDEHQRGAPDAEYHKIIAMRVELMVVLHEVAHLLLDSQDRKILDTKSRTKAFIRGQPEFLEDFSAEYARFLERTANDHPENVLDYILSDSIIDEIVCDVYAATTFSRQIAEAVVNESYTNSLASFVAVAAFYNVVDFMEDQRKLYSEIRWENSGNFLLDGVGRQIRSAVVSLVLLTETSAEIAQQMDQGPKLAVAMSSLCEQFEMATNFGSMTRYQLIEAIHSFSHARYREMLRQWSHEFTEELCDHRRKIGEYVDWPIADEC